ncbi:DUF2955 domain-containing protein [Aidingimonas halophila]|uniref:Fusaric acid resistance protein-like n=1 Tax=Aidingimonas halophila TaxID=574349 RepID=A0A1H3DCU1_9GAMM|nr:DUF2955 domain-containing protein [Aidingimonas halophila]GHC30150.1 1,4-alpha-glucan-branching protein [Aidingimonas halophila]SDX64130.1 Fusaric acid resistance protein-like [Aidingimonas halophila]
MSTEHHALSDNGLRQCLRVAGGGALGFVISHVMGWNYGVFFTVFPMFLLGLVPVINAQVIRQFIVNVCVNALEVSLVVGLTQHMPVVMTALVFALFYARFRLMARGALFLFGANGVLTLSILLHFASYPDLDLADLLASNIVASLLAVAIAMLMHAVFPDVAARQMPARPDKSPARIRHETLIGAVTATLSFVVFQIFDLRDSLSAQMATILILFALSYPGARVSAAKRAVGTLLGCNLALLLQLVLYNHGGHLVLVTLCYWAGLMLFARLHVLEGAGSGVGFGGLTTLGILFGQYLGPQQDMVYSALYRFSSMSVALVVTLAVMALLHRLLDSWEPTRSTA